MTFPIDATIPLGSHDPADDVTPMRNNFSNISSYVAIDHVAAGATGNGTHKQVTINNVSSPAAPVDPSSIIYTAASPSSAVSDLYFINSKSSFPLSAVRAFGTFTGSTGALIGNAFHATVVRNSVGNYTVTINANSVANANYLVIISCTISDNFVAGATPGYRIISATSFNINCRAFSGGNVGADPTAVSFVVFQF